MLDVSAVVSLYPRTPAPPRYDPPPSAYGADSRRRMGGQIGGVCNYERELMSKPSAKRGARTAAWCALNVLTGADRYCALVPVSHNCNSPAALKQAGASLVGHSAASLCFCSDSPHVSTPPAPRKRDRRQRSARFLGVAGGCPTPVCYAERKDGDYYTDRHGVGEIDGHSLSCVPCM